MIKIVRPTQKHIYTMALAAGFEPANPFELPVFKTGGLNRTLPSKHIKVVATKLRMATQNITTMFFRKKNITNKEKIIGTPTRNRTPNRWI